MRSFPLRRPSAAMVVALLALFVALGGGAYASVTLANNSVLSKHVKNGEVKKGDIARNAITADRTRDGEVTGTDVADGSIADADIAGIAAAKISAKVASAAASDTATSAASSANADRLDNLDSTAFQSRPLWALVDSTGAIAAQSGGIAFVAQPGTGQCHPNAGVPLTGKAIVATHRYDRFAGLADGEVAVSICGGASPTESETMECPVRGTSTTSHVYVETHNATGTAAGRDFHVVVFP